VAAQTRDDQSKGKGEGAAAEGPRRKPSHLPLSGRIAADNLSVQRDGCLGEIDKFVNLPSYGIPLWMITLKEII